MVLLTEFPNCYADVSYLTNGYLETVIDWILGMKGIRLRDLPSFVRTTDPDDIMLDFPMVESERAQKASAIFFNTFDALEHQVLDALSSMFPPIYPIGPLQSLLNQIPDNDRTLIGSNLWKEEVGCLEWLDKKEPNSVFYVNFGSVTVMTCDELIELLGDLQIATKHYCG
jgi:hypothetical protein